MPSKTVSVPNLQLDGPTVEVQFLISRELEAKYVKENKEIPPAVIAKALIDTGASNCIIKSEIPQNLGLQPVDSIKITTPSSREHQCYRYYMRMIIPSHNITYEGLFTAAPLEGQNISSLIGRDLLVHGILIYIGNANQFTFSLL